MRAVLQYFITVNAFNLLFCAVLSIISGPAAIPFIFCSGGLLAGLGLYHYYFKNQYYFYYNLGYTRTRLAFILLGVNILIAIPFMILTSVIL